jgi:hypothetical protein
LASLIAFTADIPYAGLSGVDHSCSGTECSKADPVEPELRKNCLGLS